jgi:8-oxo-dGTP pyrophosphatase MutT (NUDIX family)
VGQIERTWDGQPIALEDPRGSTVVVRRRVDERVETLLLHRAHHGPDYAGDWAWTPPAGARLPGEPVHDAAVRELEEEAGITGAQLVPFDLSGRWAWFIVDVPDDTSVDLVDPEHDRFEWVSVDAASTRVLPAVVAAGLDSIERARYGEVRFEPMTHDDLADVVRWQSAPHAAEWFPGAPVTVEEARDRYAARIAGESATRMWVVVIDGVRAGYLQAYRVDAYDEYAEKTQDPDAVAFDYLIGELERVGRGWGRVAIWSFMRAVHAISGRAAIPRQPQPSQSTIDPRARSVRLRAGHLDRRPAARRRAARD